MTVIVAGGRGLYEKNEARLTEGNAAPLLLYQNDQSTRKHFDEGKYRTTDYCHVRSNPRQAAAAGLLTDTSVVAR